MRLLRTCLALCCALFLTNAAHAQSADRSAWYPVEDAASEAGERGDFATAANLYQQACTGGDAFGCAMLARFYENGTGVTKDPVRAASLDQQACTGGISRNCTFLGHSYETGIGVAKDEVRAAGLYQQA